MTKPKLIIVDDDFGIRTFIRNFAENLGFDVGEAGTGIEFRELHGNVHVDIIVLDIIMPEEHGVELFDFIHDHHQDCKIVVITGHLEAFLDAAMKLGKEKSLNMIGSLNKPINLDELEKLLRQVLPS